jgi:hypothetical protein
MVFRSVKFHTQFTEAKDQFNQAKHVYSWVI